MNRTDPAARSPWRVVTAVAAVLLAVLAVVIVRGSAGAEDGAAAPRSPAAATAPRATPGASPSAAATASPAPSPGAPPSATAAPSPPVAGAPAPTPAAGGKEASADGFATRAPVALHQDAPFGDGVTAALLRTEAVTASGEGIGEISGPALRLTVALRNGTNAPLALDGVTVNVSYGADGAPAAPVFGDASSQPFAGTVAPGATATGVYLFSVPEDGRGKVAISVSHAALSPIVVFEGAIS